MISMIFMMFVVQFVAAQNDCSKATAIESLPFNKNITFGEDTPLSTVIIKSKESKIQAQYFSFEGTADNDGKMISIDTCSLKTTVPTTIYIFEDCTGEKASELKIESGYDQNCGYGFNFPALTFTVKKGVTYTIAIALNEANDKGTVILNMVEDSSSDFTNSVCSKAIAVESLPFSPMQHISNSKVSKTQPDCLSSAQAILWYKYTGEGKQMLVSTCNYYTNFDTRIVVVEGTKDTASCNSLKCAAQGDNGCGTRNTATVMSFMAKKGQVYFIGVYGNNREEGQFKLMIDYLSNNIPHTCPNAVPIQQLPFSYEIDILHDWPAESGSCFNTDKDLRSIYLTFTGTGSDVVFSTCKSFTSDMKTVGTAVELLSDCEDKECLLMTNEYGDCGSNMYIVKHTEKNTKYVLRMYCTDTTLDSCPLTINVYEKSESHDTCESARTLENPGTYQEIAVVENLGQSVHGCSGTAEGTDPGLWYKFIHTMEIDIEIYTIYAMSATKDEIGWIEMPIECNIHRCHTTKSQGHVRLTMDSRTLYQYVFVYPDSSRNQQGLIVQFVNEAPQKYSTCENALEIELPYTALHTFGDTTHSMACTTIISPANYYKFKMTKKQQIDVSTCFAKTLVNTGIEILKGGCKSEGGKCAVYKQESEGCAYGAVKMATTLDKGDDYILTIFSEATQALNVRQYRMVIFTEEVPENSMCSKATELPYKDGYGEYLVLNRYGRTTDFGEKYGETRGSWFHIKSPKKMTVTVRTCSPDTTTNSFIVTAAECSTKGSGDSTVSKPSKLSYLAKSSEITCDIHGTYISFDLKAGEERYIFVGPESFNTDCFIGVQISMDVDGDNEPGELSSSATGYIVFGCLYLLWALVLAVLTTAIIVIRKRTSSYTALE